MADNVTLPGTGEIVTTDEAGDGSHLQLVKLAHSADGQRTAIPADADGLRVNLASVTQSMDEAHTPGPSLIVGGVRVDGESSPVSATGDVHPLVFNGVGRLKVSTMPGIYSPITGSITGATQTVSADVSRASNVMFHVTGTFGGHNCTFEGSIDGGATWFLVQAVRSSANTIETATGALSAAPTYAWEASVNALTNFRVRATAHVSGTANWRILPGAFATEPIPAAQVTATQPVSGTVTANAATPTASIVNSAATTNGTVVKGSAGTIYGIVASNTNAAARFLKLHNSTTVTAGSTAVALTIPIPPASTVAINWGPLGMRFAAGICLSITGAAVDNDTTAIGAGEVKVTTSFI